MEDRIRLVTRGDDAGSCASANAAIVECLQAGVLKNTSVMVPGPAFQEAAERLRGIDACIGLHVVLSAEWDEVKWGPVSPREEVPSLLDENGHFTQNPGVLHRRGFSVEEAMREVRAQLRALRAAGLEPRYLDEHMGVGWIGLDEPLTELCREEGLVRDADFRYLPEGGEAKGDMVDTFLSRVAAAPPGTYVFVTHPGMDSADMRAMGHAGLAPGQVAKERDAERRFWTDARLRGAFQPVRYDEVTP